MLKKVVLVSGMSGAGKTLASSILEDMGYHIIDQYPVQLLSLLVDLIENSSDPRYNNVALATSLTDFNDFYRAFNGSELDVRVLFLDASNEVLLHRYKSTRRTHPLLISNVSNTLEEAISIERSDFNTKKDQSSVVIDTTLLTASILKSKIEKIFALSTTPVFTISFLSFGYKHGVPLDADLMIDVRFLKNPYWDLDLRMYSGNDESVYNYVMDDPVTQEFIVKLQDFLDYAFHQYVKEGKNHFTVAIGCTGGQHRSVTITNYLYKLYSKTYNCYKDHRDVKEYKYEK